MCPADGQQVRPAVSRAAAAGYDPPTSTTPPSTFFGQRFAEYATGWPPADVTCRDLEERQAYGLGLYPARPGRG